MKNVDPDSSSSLHPLRLLCLHLVDGVFQPGDFQQAKEETIPDSFRNRILVPQVLFYLYILTPVSSSFSHALRLLKRLASFQVNGRVDGHSLVTQPAFCQARSALPLEYFQALFDRLKEKVQAHYASRMTYRGYQLIGVDGSTAEVPDSPTNNEAFSSPTNKPEKEPAKPQTRILSAVNLLTGVCLEFLSGSYTDSEHGMFRNLLEEMDGWLERVPSILLLDRGFFAHKTIHKLLDAEGHFLMRIPSSFGKFTVRKNFSDGDQLLCVRTSPSTRKEHPELPETFCIRRVRFQIPGFRPMQVFTDLPFPEFSTREVAGLYWWRWRIEVFFDEVKNTLSVSNLRSRSPSGIRKELVTQMTFNNMVRCLITEATEETPTPTIGFSFEKSCRLIVETLSFLAAIRAVVGNTDAVNRIVNRMYESMLREIRSCKIDRREMRHHRDNQPREKFMEPVDEEVYFFRDYKDFREVSKEYAFPDLKAG